MPRSKTNPQSEDDLINPPLRDGPRGGRLRTGGTNRGGTGPVPSVLRMRHRAALNRTLEHTQDAMDAALEVLQNPKTSRSMKLRAAEVIFKGHDAIGKFSGTASVSLTDADGNTVDLPRLVVGVQAPVTDAAPQSDG